MRRTTLFAAIYWGIRGGGRGRGRKGNKAKSIVWQFFSSVRTKPDQDQDNVGPFHNCCDRNRLYQRGSVAMHTASVCYKERSTPNRDERSELHAQALGCTSGGCLDGENDHVHVKEDEEGHGKWRVDRIVSTA